MADYSTVITAVVSAVVGGAGVGAYMMEKLKIEAEKQKAEQEYLKELNKKLLELTRENGAWMQKCAHLEAEVQRTIERFR